jgi:hypothetical protein
MLGLALAMAPASAEAQYDRWGPRLRAGIAGEGGGFAGHIHGALGGISPRIGIQFNDYAAVLVQGHGLIGSFFPEDSDEVAGFAFHAASFELTLGSVFQLAAGPSLDFVWGCSESRGQVACARSNAYLGGDFRMAFLIGGRRDTGSRDAFSINLTAHPTLLDDGQWSTVFLLGFGVEMY